MAEIYRGGHRARRRARRGDEGRSPPQIRLRGETRDTIVIGLNPLTSRAEDPHGHFIDSHSQLGEQSPPCKVECAIPTPRASVVICCFRPRPFHQVHNTLRTHLFQAAYHPGRRLTECFKVQPSRVGSHQSKHEALHVAI